MSLKKMVVRGAIVLVAVGLVGLIAIQLVPVERTNPPVISEPNWDSPETRALAQRACFDCHSNETAWPWYSQVAPVSWLVADHVIEGRDKFNMSEWPSGEGDEAAETVAEGEMPLFGYVLMHPEAKLTPAETEQLIAGLKATFGGEASEERESAAERGGGDHDDEGREYDDD